MGALLTFYIIGMGGLGCHIGWLGRLLDLSCKGEVFTWVAIIVFGVLSLGAVVAAVEECKLGDKE